MSHHSDDGASSVIAYLIDAGADPNAVDKSGVAPLHRAVRNRCSAAVIALLLGHGASPGGVDALSSGVPGRVLLDDN